MRELEGQRKKMLYDYSVKREGNVQTELTEVAVKRVSGAKVENDLRVLRKKLQKKQYMKRRSQKTWAARVKRKTFGLEQRGMRRQSNIDNYVDKKASRRQKPKVSMSKLMIASNV